MKKLSLAACSLLLCAAVAADTDSAIEERIRSSLDALLPGVTADEIRATPIEGLYEVTFGARVIYMTGDARFLVQGKIIDLETRTELTEQRLAALKKAALNDLGEDQMVVYDTPEARHTITIFTDIDCGYCRQMHAQMDQYHAAGIRVRYLFYPRAGVGSPSFDKAVSVWCADDRLAAMDAAKAGKPLAAKVCDNPVADHYALGQLMRVQGTPAILLDSGEMIPGFVPADRLGILLDQVAAESGG